MKLIFEAEDAIIGIVCGLLLLGFTGKYFSLKLPSVLYVIAFIIFIFFILLDLVNELKDLTTHFGFIVLSIVHNLADLAISLAFISHFTGWNIPYITSLLAPYLQSDAVISRVGMFMVISNTIWLFIFPFAE